MDNPTHALVGVMLERAGLGRLYPRATLLLILSANVPDIDIVAATGGALNYLHYHRWITHSIAFLPLMALLPVLLICAFRRSFSGFLGAWLISGIAVASHLLLDWTNAYGIRFLSPFSEHWFHLDTTNIVDFWIWAILLLGLTGPWLGRLVNAEIGAKQSSSGRGSAIAVLIALFCYDAGRALLHQRAVATLESRIYQGSPPIRTAAVPIDSNPLHWKGIVEGADFVKLYDLNLAESFDVDSARNFYKPEASEALTAARQAKAVRSFLEFCQYPIWTAVAGSESAPTTRVEVRDARFGFTAGAIVDSAGRVTRDWFHF